MTISRIRIKHFRAIKDLSFEPKSLCSLVGENNSGKTTILKALDLMLGERWPDERRFSEADFHEGDTGKPIEIEVQFDQHIYTDSTNAPTFTGFKLTCELVKGGYGADKSGRLEVSFVCVDSAGNPVPRRAGRDASANTNPLRVSGVMRDQVPLLYVDVLRDYGRHGPGARWSVLRQMLDRLNKSFAADTEQIAVETPSGPTEMSRADAYDFYAAKALDILKTEELANLQDALEESVLQQMGLDASDGGLKLQLAGHDPVRAFRNLELVVEQFGNESPAQEVGAGVQSAIVIAIFRAYEQFSKRGAIFAVEEPEAFLHPQRARLFSNTLEEISRDGNQVFLATHSPYFVSLHAPETVVLVRRTSTDGSRVTQVSQNTLATDEKESIRLQSKLSAERSEMFFAKKVLLVEGPTERTAMPFVLDTLGADVNREGISIIDCEGKDGIPRFLRVAQAFDIPHVVLADLDPGKDQRPTKTLQKVCSPDNLFLLDPDFEGVSGYTAGNKIVAAHEHFSSIAKQDVPGPLLDAANRLLAI